MNAIPPWVKAELEPVKRTIRAHIIVRYAAPDGTMTCTHFDSAREVQDYVYTRIRSPRTGAATVARHIAYASGNPLHLLDGFQIAGHKFQFDVSHNIPDDCDCIKPADPVPVWEVPLFEVPC